MNRVNDEPREKFDELEHYQTIVLAKCWRNLLEPHENKKRRKKRRNIFLDKFILDKFY